MDSNTEILQLQHILIIENFSIEIEEAEEETEAISLKMAPTADIKLQFFEITF